MNNHPLFIIIFSTKSFYDVYECIVNKSVSIKSWSSDLNDKTHSNKKMQKEQT